MKLQKTASLALVLALASACDTGPRSGRGFRLPDGDAEKGEATFAELGCPDCHEVVGTKFPPPTEKPPVMVRIGGPTHRIETYGELVTSIINPSHRLVGRYPREKVAVGDESRMENFNDRMTVAQLIDLVAFLQSKYEFFPRPVYIP